MDNFYPIRVKHASIHVKTYYHYGQKRYPVIFKVSYNTIRSLSWSRNSDGSLWYGTYTGTIPYILCSKLLVTVVGGCTGQLRDRTLVLVGSCWLGGEKYIFMLNLWGKGYSGTCLNDGKGDWNGRQISFIWYEYISSGEAFQLKFQLHMKRDNLFSF